MCFSGSWLYAQDAKSLIHKGNELYSKQKYNEAASAYSKSVEKKGALPLEGNFNLGDALYKQKKYDDAAQRFTDIGSSAASPAVKAGAYHNLGNSLLESKKYQESIDAYKKALLNNPKDDETRYNLAYAQEKLKQQQQQNKKNNKNDKNNQNKDQNKQNQDKKDQDKKNQDKKDQQNKDQDKKDQQKQQQQQQPNKLSKEDAQRMLDALNNNEKNTQDKLKNKKLKGAKMHIDKDW